MGVASYYCLPAREPHGTAVSASLCAACVERARKATSVELSPKERESGLDASLALEARRRVEAISTLRNMEGDSEIAERWGGEEDDDEDAVDRLNLLDARRAVWRNGNDADGAGRLIESLLAAETRLAVPPHDFGEYETLDHGDNDAEDPRSGSEAETESDGR
ncbi:hypothetical protein T492DRAFT_885578 [Pavlovales sp. CCMP2436]|nr:hypothetical protein T492DRAFT_885578 [Pavlovales sp. CCMP2436]